MKGRIGAVAGGIGGSGIYGGVGAGVVCQSTDNSWYCTLTKFTSALMQIFTLLFIIYVIWTYGLPMLGLRRGGGTRSR